MSNSEKSFLKELVLPIFLAILTPAATALGSKVAGGNWSDWFRVVPRWTWIAGGGVLIAWVVILLIRRRLSSLHSRRSPGIMVFRTPQFGWKRVGTHQYAGVVWIVQMPADAPWGPAPFERRGIEDFDVATPPRCPKCGTEIEEKPRFWGGYLWCCVGCGFRKKNGESFYSEYDRVLRLVQRNIERGANGT